MSRRKTRNPFPMKSRPVVCHKCSKETTKAKTTATFRSANGRSSHRVCKDGCK